MSVDSLKTTFYSGWNIDKLILKDQVNVSVPSYPSAGVSILDLRPYMFTNVPKFFALISFDGGITWFLSGGGSVNLHSPIKINISTLEMTASAWSAGANVIIKYWIFSSDIT